MSAFAGMRDDLLTETAMPFEMAFQSSSTLRPTQSIHIGNKLLNTSYIISPLSESPEPNKTNNCLVWSSDEHSVWPRERDLYRVKTAFKPGSDLPL